MSVSFWTWVALGAVAWATIGLFVLALMRAAGVADAHIERTADALPQQARQARWVRSADDLLRQAVGTPPITAATLYEAGLTLQSVAGRGGPDSGHEDAARRALSERGVVETARRDGDVWVTVAAAPARRGPRTVGALAVTLATPFDQLSGAQRDALQHLADVAAAVPDLTPAPQRRSEVPR